ncbi:chemotaxis protein CheW [bacterium]|nr:chemotaxis protein CheW [bacterium]
MDRKKSTLDELLHQKTGHRQKIIEVDEKTVKVVIFRLADQWYAFYGDDVSEILPENTPVFFVPGCPPSLRGVINVRGEIESVIDISTILKLNSAQEATSAKNILLAKGKTIRSGICVNEVIDVVDIAENMVKAPPETLPDHLCSRVSGVFQFHDRAVSVLNLEQIFTDYQQGAG